MYLCFLSVIYIPVSKQCPCSLSCDLWIKCASPAAHYLMLEHTVCERVQDRCHRQISTVLLIAPHFINDWRQRMSSVTWREPRQVRDRWDKHGLVFTAQQAWQLCRAVWAFHAFLSEPCHAFWRPERSGRAAMLYCTSSFKRAAIDFCVLLIQNFILVFLEVYKNICCCTVIGMRNTRDCRRICKSLHFYYLFDSADIGSRWHMDSSSVQIWIFYVRIPKC